MQNNKVLKLLLGIVCACLLACKENKRNIALHENPELEAMYSLSSLQVLQKSLEHNPDDAETLYKLALWHRHHQEYQKAEEYLQEALKIKEDERFYLLEAQIQYTLNKPKQSYITWTKAYRLAPQNLPILLFGLKWAVEQKETAKVRKWTAEIEKYFPNDSRLFLWKAKWAIQEQDTTQAFVLLEQALLQNASLTEPYKYISFLYNQTQQPEKALEWAEKGLLIKPLYDSLLLEKALAWQTLKQEDSAAKYFLQAYQLNRNFYQASYFLGIQRWKAARYTEALSFLENTYRLQQNLPKLAYYLANCYEKLQKYPQAIEFYKKSIAQEPENALIFQSLYLLQEKLALEKQKRQQDSIRKAQAEKIKKLSEQTTQN